MNMDMHGVLRAERYREMREEAEQGRRIMGLSRKEQISSEAAGRGVKKGPRFHFVLLQPRFWRGLQRVLVKFGA
ncbi:MAG TPA: hypothetical protein VF458_11570 [Ktedonobacteraceae bacterium]